MSDGGEPLQAVLARAIAEAVAAREREIRAEVAIREPEVGPPTLPPALPFSGYLRNLTLPASEKAWGPLWPNGEPGLPQWQFREARDNALRYATERAARRAVIEVLDQWDRGELELWTLRRDGAWELLPTHLRHSPAVMLRVHTGRFVPAPQDDPLKYSELKVLQPASAAIPPKPKPETSTDLSTPTVADMASGTASTPSKKTLADDYAEQNPTLGQRRLFDEWNETQLKKQGKKRLHPERNLRRSPRRRGRDDLRHRDKTTYTTVEKPNLFKLPRDLQK